jgi:AcrR family transcriptional regulator
MTESLADTLSSADAPGTRGTRMPKEKRREQVMAQARKVFMESGYHAAGMDEIAEAAGVSKPVLYQHFPSKLELYLALLDRGIDELLQSADAALASTTDNKERVGATMRAYFAFVADRNSAYRLVFESDVMNESAVRARVDRAPEAIASKIADVISADTGLSNEQAMLLGSGLQGLAQVAASRWLVGEQSEMSLEDAADLVASLAWRGIRSFPLTHPPDGTPPS